MKLFGVVASSFLLVAGLGAPASAEAEWYPPATDLTAPGRSVSVSALATNARGDLTASLLVDHFPYPDGPSDVKSFDAVQRPAGGIWTQPVTVGGWGDIDGHSDVAIDSRGNATIVMNEVGAVDAEADGQWTTPMDLDPTDYESPTKIEVDPRGNQTVVGITHGANWRIQTESAVPPYVPNPPVRTSPVLLPCAPQN